jgi:nucleoside-diphosphate-sugar epimerase
VLLRILVTGARGKVGRAAYPSAETELRPVDRPDASGIDTAKAARLLGWRATRSWRDYLAEDGSPTTPRSTRS